MPLDLHGCSFGTHNPTGIITVHSELLPEDKATLIGWPRNGGRNAIFGDGVNDAPVLATADVGCVVLAHARRVMLQDVGLSLAVIGG